MSNKRIFVTGIGATSPIGGTAGESWDALLAGESGARTLEHEWVEQYQLPVTFAAEAKVRPETVLERPVAKRLDPSSQLENPMIFDRHGGPSGHDGNRL